MKAFTDILRLRTDTELLLLLSFLLFILAGLFFLIIIFLSRYLKNYRAKKEAAMLPVIEAILFPVVFNGTPYHILEEDKLWAKYRHNKTFRQMMVSGIFKMHKTYSGAYTHKLRQLFIESGLARETIQSLQTTSWSKKCEAIRILSQLNITEAYEPILTLIYANEDILRLEALVAIVQMKGMEGVRILMQYTMPVNDWIQINLIYHLKSSDADAPPDFGFLLSSGNADVVKLGCRLIEAFQQKTNVTKLQNMIGSYNNLDLEAQIRQTILKLESF